MGTVQEVMLCPPVTGKKKGACVAGGRRRIRNLWTEQEQHCLCGPGLNIS
jgi:hypothetical protein